MNKKILIIAAIVLIIVISAIIAFVFINNKDEGSTTTEQEVEEKTILEKAKDIFTTEESKDSNIIIEKAQKGVNLASEEKISFPELIDNEIYYYSADSGTYNKFIIEENGRLVPKLLIENIKNPFYIDISSDKNKILVQDTTGFYHIDIDSKDKKYLPQGTFSAIWHPDGSNKILYSYANYPYSNINLLDIENNQRELLVELYVDEGMVNNITASGNVFSYWRHLAEKFNEDEEEKMLEQFMEHEDEAEALDYESLYPDAGNGEIPSVFIIHDKENNKEILRNLNTSGGVISNDGRYVLMEDMQQTFATFILYDLQNNKMRKLNLSSYFDKAKLSDDSKYLYYGKVEKFTTKGTNDTLWRLDLETRKKIQYTELETDQKYCISYIMITSDNKKAYFINQLDKKLFQVNIE